MMAPLDCPLLPMHPLPRVTDHLPGCGGQIRLFVEDFEVEEIPLYLPSGEGEHLYLFVQKRDMTGDFLRRHIARTLVVSPRDVGMAGLKDRRAVTRQWLSVPKSAAARVPALSNDRVQVLEVATHRNKLRTGHLAGNRFRIRVRNTVPDAAPRVQAKLDALALTGVADFFGSQRMGQGGSTLAGGWALAHGADGLCRVRTPDETVHTLHLEDRSLRRLAASALQSEVFNRVLTWRVAQGVWRQVLAGDLCRKRASGGLFLSDDAERDQLRLLAGELDVTGPMWGPKMMQASGRPAEIEAQMMAECGLTLADFAAIGHLAEGTRRPLSVPVHDASLQAHDDGITVQFQLPAGAFATVVLHELMGPVAADEVSPAWSEPLADLVSGEEAACA